MVKTSENGILAQLRRTPSHDLDQSDVEADAQRMHAQMERDRVTCDGSRLANPGTGTVKLAHDGQKGLVYVLLKKLRTHNPDVEVQARAWFEAHKDDISSVAISDVIDRLRGHLANPARQQPFTPRPPVDFTAPTPSTAWAEWRTLAAQLVTFGGAHGSRFAIDTEDGAVNTVAFWWIVPGRDGRYWLRQMIGGHNEAVRVQMAPEAMVTIAKKIIAAGPKEAMLRYGRELGRCGHCFRTLTNDESRALGIGPVCRKVKGW